MGQTEKEKSIQIVEETVQEMIDKMGFVSQVEIANNAVGEDGAFVCNIKSEDSNFLIGQHGVNLQALQHIARLLTRAKTDEKINFIVDVNFYRQEKNEFIGRMAKEAAEQAIREKRTIVLRPMSPYERRIIHMELAENSLVKTESIGEGENRKVVVKPADMI